ncbi:MAG: hypothetical protein AAGA92_09715 [Planctomycetota bacterium]
MPKRFTHAAIAFAALAVTYQMYRLVVCPFIEPAQSAATAAFVPSAEPTHRYRDLLAAYFPPNHWCLVRPPKTIENDNTLLVIDQYTPHPDDNGQLNINRCVLLVFPTPRGGADPAPSDAVIVEAPGGADLHLDGSFRIGPKERGTRLQKGLLRGEVTVRSGMREPGPEDDLLLVTRDVYLNENLLRTEQPVRLAIGPHRATGRVLEAKMLPTEGVGGRVGRIDTVELLHDVRVELAVEGLDLGTNGNAQAAPAPAVVTSGGPFVWSLPNATAAFSEGVRVTQSHPGGVEDRLECRELKLYFQTAEGSGSDGIDLRPASLEALADAGGRVRLDAPSQQAAAECQRLWIDLGPRRVTLEDLDEAVFTHGDTEVRAPTISYRAPARGSDEQLGTFLASPGGHLTTAPKDGASAPLKVRWTRSMQLTREEGRPVLRLHGRPKVSLLGTGDLWADQVRIDLLERAGEEPTGGLPAAVAPERLVAEGQVAIDSNQLNGSVGRMTIDFDYPDPAAVGGAAAGSGPSATDDLTAAGPAGRSYSIAGGDLAMRVRVAGNRPAVSAIRVERRVEFRENHRADSNSEPLEFRGDVLTIENADTEAARVTLTGSPAAEVVAGTASLSAREMQLLRGSDRIAVEAPGELRLLSAKSITGQPLARPEPVVIRWERSLNLVGREATFLGNVRVVGAGAELAANRLVATLSRAVQFDSNPRSAGPVDIEQVEAREGVRGVVRQTDPAGPTSISIFQSASISVNQSTGAIGGEGPGWLEMAHLAAANARVFSIVPGKQQTEPSPQRLRFLRVEFIRGLTGNLHERRVEAVGQARAVYGPIDAWEQRLQMADIADPRPETVFVEGERIQLAESPAAVRPPGASGAAEVRVTDNVVIEGKASDGSLFTARGRRASYSQSKELLVLEGTQRNLAAITYQQYPGGPQQPLSGQKFLYWLKTGEIEGNLNQFNWTIFDTGRNRTGGVQR